jgi:putative transposase
MSASYHRTSPLSWAQVLAPFFLGTGLPLANVLSPEDIRLAFAAAGVAFGATYNAVFTPEMTLWAFLSQVLDKSKSCRAAVLRVSPLLALLGRKVCAAATGAYCRARAKIPVSVLRHLTLWVGRRVEAAAPKGWLWHGQSVKLVDGTTVTAPDTKANQRVYPQSSSQQPGLGFPLIRMVVVMSLATALLCGLALGPYSGKETGETALLRHLLDELAAGEVIVADRYYCSYWLVVMAWQRGVNVVFRMHHRRDYDFRRGQRLGRRDHVVEWRKPARPEWMDVATYQALPSTLTVRELKYSIEVVGCRAKSIVVVTTFLDRAVYTKEDLADLYHYRWYVELDLRSIKETMGMDQLRCKTPAMLAKEIWAYWLGYNLVRQVSCQAGKAAGIHPREVSFAATQQMVLGGWQGWTLQGVGDQGARKTALLGVLGKEQVGQRPDRIEPRARKRRGKGYPYLGVPRAQAREEVLQGRWWGKKGK